MKSPWWIRVGDALSQFLNVLLLNGHPNESLSGRAFRVKSRWRYLIDAVLWFDADHCQTAYLNDLAYAKTLISEDQNDRLGR